MFTLLDILLRRIVRRGSLTLIDADGIAHRYGDGSPPVVSLRLADKRHRAAARGRSGAGARRGLHGRPARDDRGPHLRLPRAVPLQPRERRHAGLDPELQRRPLPQPPADAVQSVRARAAQRGAPLRHRRRHLRPLPRSRPAVFLRLLHRGRRPRGGAARQEAPPRGQARHRARAARARHRLGLGRARALSRQGRPLRRHRRDAQQRAAQGLPRARGQGGLEPRGAFRVQGLPQGRGPLRPHRLGRHVRARGRQPLRAPTSASCAICSPTTAWR